MGASKLAFFIYCAVALILSVTPIVSIPFLYLTTVFHELSHGVATLVTGGVIQEFNVQTNGAGHLISRGGYHIIIAFSGYFGAPIWGALLYLSASHLVVGRATLMTLIAIFLMTLLLWVNTIVTAGILLLIIAMLGCALLVGKRPALRHVIRCTAILVVFNSIVGPLYLLGSSKGDSVTLAQLLYIPELIWIGLWLSWGVFILYRLFNLSGSNVASKT